MAPKNKFTKEEIVGAAKELVREKGLSALTARELAKRLGSSPRPIFTAFRSMKEVADAVAIVAAGVAETTATATATTMKRVADADTAIKSGICIFYIERVRHEQYIW